MVLLGQAEQDVNSLSAVQSAFDVTGQSGIPGALNGLGQVYLAQRKYSAAETYLLKAAPQAPAAWYGLTKLYLLALLITMYGALLRLDALTGKYGTLEHPAWARVATHPLAGVASHLRPTAVSWPREPNPYVGGDPINYLKYAREMRTFYQPHVREPMFLAATRAGLAALDQQDAGVSLASAAGSTLAIFGTFLLGAAVISPAGGLLAAAIFAVEYDVITWAVDGWRDDFFTATVLFAAWSLIRFHRSPSFSKSSKSETLMFKCGIEVAIALSTPASLSSFSPRSSRPF